MTAQEEIYVLKFCVGLVKKKNCNNGTYFPGNCNISETPVSFRVQ
jgi:hypothetical protein